MEPYMDLNHLAHRSAGLSNSLSFLGDQCEHDTTRNDITDIASETLLLSTTLWSLHQAVDFDDDRRYTDAFHQDLRELLTELNLVFDEIDECCKEMHKTDTPGAVPWFFKKGRVAKLQKHLVALKSTMAVMRTVLEHGKSYGVQGSPARLAESAPHVLGEDRAILDSIFALNRRAIEDLHQIEERKKSHERSSTASSISTGTADFRPGAHGRNISSATGIELPRDSDVLPDPKAIRHDVNVHQSRAVQRRFSKRGVRLGVHMSIMDMGAHETTEGLRKRWLQAARSAHTSDSSHHRRMTTISEDGTGLALREVSQDDASSGGDEAANDSNPKPGEVRMSDEQPSRRRGNSLKLISSNAGSAMSRLIKRLSFSNNVVNETDHIDATNPDEHSITKKISNKLRMPEITTPEFNAEFENGALASMKKRY